MSWEHSIDYEHLMIQYMLHEITLDELWDKVGTDITEEEYSAITGLRYPDKE